MQPGIGIALNSSQRRDLRMLFRYTHPKPEEVAAKLSTSSPLVRRRAGGGLLARRHL
jgi:hypothetical protein